MELGKHANLHEKGIQFLSLLFRSVEQCLQSENFTAPSTSQKADGANSVAADHGNGGPVQVSFPTAMYGGSQQISFVNATKNLFNITHCPDLCSGAANCASLVSLVHNHFIDRLFHAYYPYQSINAQNADRRSSSAEAYLTPVETTATNWLTLTGQMVMVAILIALPVCSPH